MIRTQISFDEPLYKAARAHAKRLGISLAELCRRAVASSVAKASPPAGDEVKPWMRHTGTISGGRSNDSDNESIDAVVYGRERP